MSTQLYAAMWCTACSELFVSFLCNVMAVVGVIFVHRLEDISVYLYHMSLGNRHVDSLKTIQFTNNRLINTLTIPLWTNKAASSLVTIYMYLHQGCIKIKMAELRQAAVPGSNVSYIATPLYYSSMFTTYWPTARHPTKVLSIGNVLKAF